MAPLKKALRNWQMKGYLAMKRMTTTTATTLPTPGATEKVTTAKKSNTLSIAWTDDFDTMLGGGCITA